MTNALLKTRTFAIVALALTSLCLAVPGLTQAGDSRDLGRRATSEAVPADQSSAGPICAPILDSDTSTLSELDHYGYGKPNQSRVWFNSLAGRWDGLVPRNDGGDSGSDHYIVLDLAGVPSFTGVEVEARNQARPDAYWDDANGKLYILSSHPDTPMFWQFDYVPGAGLYAVNPEVNGVAVPGVEQDAVSGENQPAALYRSPDGDLWVGVLRAGFFGIQHSEDGGKTWLPQPVLLDDSVTAGVTSWVHFESGGTTYVGLFAGEDGENGHPATDFFFWLVDQDADPAVLSNWTDDSANIPAPFGSESADNHVCATRDSLENQYFVVKTEAGGPLDPRVKLFTRTASGVWSQFKVLEDQELPHRTRPSVIIDETNEKLLIFVSETGGGDGMRKRVPLDMPELLLNAPLTTVFTASGAEFDDIIAPRQTVNSESGVVLLAHDEADDVVWVSAEPIVAGGPDAPVAVADDGLVNEGESVSVASPGVLANDSDPQDDPLTALLVSGPTHGSLTLNLDGSYQYTHDGSETVSDSFYYEAVEPSGAVSSTVLVQLTVTPMDDAPLALDDAYALDQGGTLVVGEGPGVLANDTDAEGTALTATLTVGPAYGSVTLNTDGSFAYTHESDELFADSFTYVAEDATGQISLEATVVLDVVATVGMRVQGSATASLSEIGSLGYGKPNQTRIWFNAAAARWDALIPKDDGGGSGSRHYLLTDVPGAQNFTSLQLEPRDDARPSIFWDEARQSLHVLGSHETATLIWRLDYNAGSDSYSIDPAVDAVVVPGLVHRSENDPASIFVSPNGRIWAAVMRDDALEVQQSTDGGATWLSSPVMLNDDALFGVTDWSWFERQGRTWVGLFASEDGDRAAPSHYSYRYIDQDADAGILENWIDDSANMPGPMGDESADDHVSAARDAAGNQYFVARTQTYTGPDPLIKLLKRTPAGLWSQYLVARYDEQPRQTRPSVVVDDANAEIRIYATDTGGGTGQRKRARLDDLDGLADAPFLTVLQSLGDSFDDIITPRHAVGSAGDLVVLGHSETARMVWAATETIGEDLCMTIQGGNAQSELRSIPLVGGLETLQAEIFRPELGRQTGACPLISMLPPMSTGVEDVRWAAERLANDGYVVVLTQPADATPESYDVAARAGIDFMSSVENPWLEVTDTLHVGGVGGPVGGNALTLSQEIDIRLDAIVEWDNLAMSEYGDAGSPSCDMPVGPVRTPFVPAMGQASDSCAKDADDKKAGYDWWRANDVETMQLVFADSDSGWWGAAGTQPQHDRIHHYTLAWFDRWLKADPAASARLTATEIAAEPVAPMLDDYYRSAIFFDGNDCPDFRAMSAGAPEVCDSGVDDNCDRLIDCQDTVACPAGPGAVPGEIAGVIFGSDAETLEWQSSTGVVVYDVLWGRLDDLRADGGFERSECLSWREPGLSLLIEEQPTVPGSVWYYLVRGKDDPCLLGSWGSEARDVALLTCP